MKNFHLAILGGSGKLGSLIGKLHPNCTIINTKTKRCTIDFNTIDVFLDVSQREVITPYLRDICAHKIPLVIGSTGHDKKTLSHITSLKEVLPVIIAPNFSQGIFLLKKLLKSFDISPSNIEETHHTHKKDSPSGTAKMLQALYPNPPHIDSIRKDGVFGKHTLNFSFFQEEITLTHKALSRNCFAKGAIQACSFLHKKEKGIYTMDDVYKEY